MNRGEARRVAIATAGLALGACGGATPAAKPATSWQTPTAGVEATSGQPVERLFPLRHGTLYHYRTESLGERPDQGVTTFRVARSSASEGELRKPSGVQRFTFANDGVRTTTRSGAEGFVLRWPLDPAARWRGPHDGTARLSALDVSISVPAGTFTGCITTIEERGGDRPLRVATTLCPEVGIVALEASSGGEIERASLVQHGEPVELGADGVTRTPATAP